MGMRCVLEVIVISPLVCPRCASRLCCGLDAVHFICTVQHCAHSQAMERLHTYRRILLRNAATRESLQGTTSPHSALIYTTTTGWDHKQNMIKMNSVLQSASKVNEENMPYDTSLRRSKITLNMCLKGKICKVRVLASLSRRYKSALITPSKR